MLARARAARAKKVYGPGAPPPSDGDDFIPDLQDIEDAIDEVTETVEEVSLAARRVNKAWNAVKSTYMLLRKYLKPVFVVLEFVFGLLGRAFDRLAYLREDGAMKLDADGDPIFSAKLLTRNAALAFGALFAAYAVLSGVFFYATHFEEKVFVTGKGMYHEDYGYFTGCTSLPCDTQSQNSKYYNVEESWFFPYLLYPEEDVMASVPIQNGVCDVKGYGIYFKRLKWLHKSLKWYQNVYKVTCNPLSDEQLREIIDGGALNAPGRGE